MKNLILSHFKFNGLNAKYSVPAGENGINNPEYLAILDRFANWHRRKMVNHVNDIRYYKKNFKKPNGDKIFL